MSLEIQKLYFSYPSSHVTLFENFSLQFNDGWTCIAGSNGCGKSTLLRTNRKWRAKHHRLCYLLPSGNCRGAGKSLFSFLE